ncbi:putative reverse transcriptase domain-containing protein [Tanacetum coccineum]
MTSPPHHHHSSTLQAPPSPPYQGRSREVPKLRIEAKKQEKQSLEVVTRRTNPKTPFRPISSSIFSPLHDDLYMEIMQAYDATVNELLIPPLQAPIAPPTVVSPSLVLSLSNNCLIIEIYVPPKEISPPKRHETHRGITHFNSSPSSSVGSSSPVRIMPLKSAPMTQAAIRRMIKESVDAAIAAERARQANVRNDASGYGSVRGPALTWWKTKVATMGLETVNQMPWTKMKQLMTAEFCPTKEVQRMEHELWNLKVKEYEVVAYTQRFNELALMCPRMGEVKSSKPADLNEVVRMAHKLMEQKSQARDARILEGKKQKWESYQSGNSSGKGNQRDNSRQTLQNSQKQGNARAMVTAPTDGKLPLCETECFYIAIVGCVTIKCHNCGKVGHKARYCKEKSVATGANAQPVWTCYDCGEQGPNVVTGTFLLNNCYAFVLFDSGSDRSFVDTRFNFMLDIDPIKIGASYEVELADGRVVSTNTVLKGCTLSLVNHVIEIDLMPIELGTFDVIIGMDWLVKHDAVIVYGEKVVRIPYGNKMLIVESDKGVSRLKVISCIKAYVPVIRDFPEVFPKELPGLPPPRQVEFRIDLVPGVAPVARAPYRLAPSEMKEIVGTIARAAGEGIYSSEFITVGSTDVGYGAIAEDNVSRRLLAARSRQKSYADKRAKPLELEVGDMVLLKVSPWKDAVRFGKRGKLSSRYIGPFKILARVGPVAYTLEFPEELKGIHSTFHVSNLKKCLAEGNVVVPMDEIRLDDKLHMIEEPVAVVDREVKRLKQSRIPIV